MTTATRRRPPLTMAESRAIRAEWAADLARAGLTEADVRGPTGMLRSSVLRDAGIELQRERARRWGIDPVTLSLLLTGQSHGGARQLATPLVFRLTGEALADTKRQALAAMATGESACWVARQLGLYRSTVNNWRKAAAREGGVR